MASLNEQAFLAAAFPEPFRMLGCELRPFAVGHRMLLARLGNRLVTGSERPGVFDLLQALFVCTRDWNSANRKVRTRAFNRWLWRIRLRLWLRRLLVRLGILPIASASVDAFISAFADYLRAHSIGPEMAPTSEEGAREPGTPAVQFIVVSLVAYLNHTPDEAMNEIWGRALHDVFAYWELEGRAHLVSEEEREAHQEHLQLLKELNDKLVEIEKGLGV